MNHAALTEMHEAGHATLWPGRRRLNELHGVAIGTVALIPLSVYRYVHARHHAHLGRARVVVVDRRVALDLNVLVVEQDVPLRDAVEDVLPPLQLGR